MSRVYENRSYAVYRDGRDQRSGKDERNKKYSKYFKYSSECESTQTLPPKPKKPTLLDIQYQQSEKSRQLQQQNYKKDDVDIINGVNKHKNIVVKEVQSEPFIQIVYINQGKIESKMQIGLEGFLEKLVNRLAKSDMVFDFDNQNIYSLVVPTVSTLYFNSYESLVNCIKYFEELIEYRFSSYISHYIEMIDNFKKFWAEKKQ